MTWLPLAAILGLLAGMAQAHETTRSYLALEREGTAVTARLSLAFRDVEVVAWMDEDLDGRITWGEAKARLDEAASYASARLDIVAGGTCPLTPTGAGASQSGGIDYLDLVFSATCPEAAAPLEVGTTLFAEIDPGHRLFLTASEGGRQASLVLASGATSTGIATDAGTFAGFATYFRAGVEHLLAGADHLAFLLVLMLPAAVGTGAIRGRVLDVVAAVTGFTIAHAVTLTAAATEVLRPPTQLIETLIALSILVTAIDNVQPFIPGPRAALAAFFGTIHGFGFATALSGLALGGGGFVVALLGFNLGIEVAQLGMVLLALPALATLGGRWVLWTGSALAATISLVWLWQRAPALLELI